MYVERSLDRGYGRRDIGISRSKNLRMKIKKQVEKFMFLAKDRNVKVSAQLHHFLDSLDEKMDYQTKFANKFSHNKFVKGVNLAIGSLISFAGKMVPNEEDVASDFDFWTALN